MKANVNNDGIQSLNINLGGIRLAVNGDENRVISFNPDDIGFAEAFYTLIGKVDDYQDKYTAKAKELDEQTEVDEHGIKKNQPEIFKMYREMCSELRTDIDNIFGVGTSDKCFGSANTLDMFAEFFKAITPFVEKSRHSKIEKYTKKSGKAVMK